MTIFESATTGIVQGITEFLPISSTAHLILLPKFFGWPDLGLKLDTALHLGTAVAVIVFFAKDWIKIVQLGVESLGLGMKKSDRPQNTNPETSNFPRNLLWQIIVGTIPAIIAGYLIADKIEQTLYKPSIIAFTLVIFGVIIWAIDKSISQKRDLSQIKYSDSLIVGAAQAVALIPGVSRSGITMIAGRLIGLSRESSARFSFLLSTPAVFGAFFLQAVKLETSDLTLPFFIAVISSTLAGILVIKYLLDYLKNHDFTVFAVYRILLAILIISIL